VTITGLDIPLPFGTVDQAQTFLETWIDEELDEAGKVDVAASLNRLLVDNATTDGVLLPPATCLKTGRRPPPPPARAPRVDSWLRCLDSDPRCCSNWTWSNLRSSRSGTTYCRAFAPAVALSCARRCAPSTKPRTTGRSSGSSPRSEVRCPGPSCRS